MRQEAMDRIHLVQDTDNCYAFVNTVLDLWISQNAGNFLIA
jgi:hypothetical protein